MHGTHWALLSKDILFSVVLDEYMTLNMRVGEKGEREEVGRVEEERDKIANTEESGEGKDDEGEKDEEMRQYVSISLVPFPLSYFRRIFGLYGAKFEREDANVDDPMDPIVKERRKRGEKLAKKIIGAKPSPIRVAELSEISKSRKSSPQISRKISIIAQGMESPFFPYHSLFLGFLHNLMSCILGEKLFNASLFSKTRTDKCKIYTHVIFFSLSVMEFSFSLNCFSPTVQCVIQKGRFSERDRERKRVSGKIKILTVNIPSFFLLSNHFMKVS
jgi:hypothetical protein